MQVMRCVVMAAVAIGLAASGAAAGDWPQWRGPAFNGSAPGEKDLPSTWTKTEGVAWTAKMPGQSSATPAIVGDLVFVSSVDSATKDLLAICLSVKDGKEIWRKKIGTDRPAPSNNTMASPSPVTDGKTVVFFYGSGNMMALDVGGAELWRRNIELEVGNFCIKYGYSSSPLLYKGTLYVPVLRGIKRYFGPPLASDVPIDSFILAINPSTGKDIWKHVRQTDAVNESREAYITPMPFERDGRAEILIPGGDYVTGHDLATGKELWRWGYNPSRRDAQRLVPSVVTDGGFIYFTQPRGQTLFALKGGATGTAGDDIVAWKFTGPTTDSSTPLFYAGTLYLLDDSKKCLTAVDPKTSTEKWQVKLGGSAWRASPTGADGKVYCISEAGEVAVIAADDGRIISRIPMGGNVCCASIAVAGGRLYIRTSEALYAIGK